MFLTPSEERKIMFYTSTIDVTNSLSGEDVVKLAFQSDNFDELKDFTETVTGSRLDGVDISEPVRNYIPGNDNLKAAVSLGITDTLPINGHTVRKFPFGSNGVSEALCDVLEGYTGEDLGTRLSAWRSDVAL